MTSLPRPCLMLVTEPSPRLPEIVAEAVAGGVDIVQLRDKTAEPVTLFETAWELRGRIGGKALFVINGRLGDILVRKTDANGVHQPASIASARALIGDRLIGCSVHSLGEAQAAAEEGTDYIIAGTIFASQSHPDIAPAGLDFLRDVCAAVALPVLAIGGVTPKNVADCVNVGAAGVAVLSPLMRAADPKATAQTYRTALDAAWEEHQCSSS